MFSHKDINIAAIDGAGEFSAYLVEPDSNQAPGIVLIQEIFGINSNMRTTADHLASEGFRVCVPDLFWRIEPGVELDSESEAGREKAVALMQSLDKKLALQDCVATMNYLRSDSPKVGSVGYCLGGRLAYHMATLTDVDCSIGYYGVGIDTVLEQARELSTPLMLHIPENDHLCDVKARQAIYDTLEPLENAQLFTYAGVGHAFARLGRPLACMKNRQPWPINALSSC